MKYKYFAIDFDGTIVEDDFPKIGKIKENAIHTINRIKNNGGKIAIWTCRPSAFIYDFLVDNNIPFDTINENFYDLQIKYGNDCRKIGADVYIDDKSIFSDINWFEIEKHIFGVDKT